MSKALRERLAEAICDAMNMNRVGRLEIEAADAVLSVLSTLEEGGWKLVPVEATEDMVLAAVRFRAVFERPNIHDSAGLYREMLAAAPVLKDTKP